MGLADMMFFQAQASHFVSLLDRTSDKATHPTHPPI